VLTPRRWAYCRQLSRRLLRRSFFGFSGVAAGVSMMDMFNLVITRYVMTANMTELARF
jgi:hypothetical protein